MLLLLLKSQHQLAFFSIPANAVTISDTRVLSKYALAEVTLVLKMTDNVQFKRPKKQTYFFIFT
jgi:hypothetical protein